MPNICAAAAALRLAAISCFSLSKTSSRFFICFLSLALRFWNQIFTCKVDYTLSSTRANIVQHVFLINDHLRPYLSLGKLQCLRQLGLSPDGDVLAEVELPLQLESLVIGIDNPILVVRPRL